MSVKTSVNEQLALTPVCTVAGTDDLSSVDLGEATSSSQVELARLLFWLMVVGYNLRTLEVRFDMEQTMMLPSGV